MAEVAATFTHAVVEQGSDLRELEASVRGEVIRPGDGEYDGARQIWNAMIDRRPSAIVRCTGPADVKRCVDFARERQMLLAVRGGGHNVAGNALCDGGLVIDLSRMRGVWVDPDRRRARVQAGCVMGDLDRETAAYGLATTGGHVSTTGVAGLTLGGGLGWLMRKHGLTCDNLRSADVVTADGRMVRASAEENADLFWGLRGGGGNFGVVTSFEFQLYPLQTVLGGMIVYDPEQAPDLVRFYREYVQGVPDDLCSLIAFATVPPIPPFPPELHGKAVVAAVVCYTGDPAEGERVLAPLRSFGPPLADMTGPMPYTALQQMLDPTAPPGLQNYWKSGYMPALTDESIERIVEVGMSRPTPQTLVLLLHLDGAMGRVGRGETAFSFRYDPFVFNVFTVWDDPADQDRNMAWTRDFWGRVEPHLSGTYVNFLSNEGEDRVRASYDPETYARLVEVKRRWDPGNLFRVNQNIKP